MQCYTVYSCKRDFHYWGSSLSELLLEHIGEKGADKSKKTAESEREEEEEEEQERPCQV